MKSKANQAIEIPLDDECGLTINVGRDGVWLHFMSKCLHASVNIDAMAEKDTMLEQALRSWTDDQREKADQITRDNGLFGVGS